MTTLNITRRAAVIGGGAAGIIELATGVLTGATPVFAAGNEPVATPFSAHNVEERAFALSKKPFEKPQIEMPPAFRALNYTQYRDIRFKPERAIWKTEQIDTQIQLFAMGYLFDVPVEIWLADKGKATRLQTNQKDFSIGALAQTNDPRAPYGLSGFRLHGPINRDDYFDEYVVFQGASYFRAVAKDQQYGLSARGLSINTARPEGEEFPIFRSFWIEKPKPGADQVIVHALLDSQSVTGSYTFTIRPGRETAMKVTAKLFARTSIAHAGIAPMTSMYLFGPAHRRIKGDFRPAVHDSEGLAIFNGSGERLWRPLTNPKTLQTSTFMDNNPKGFGLIQRDRKFKAYEDLEAHYEARPSLWVEPIEGWGRGRVELVEIPAAEEIHDNVVAYWKPETPIEPGEPRSFSYRLRWISDGPETGAQAKIVKTRVGNGRAKNTARFVIDINGGHLQDFHELPIAKLTCEQAKAQNVVVRQNPHIDGLRTSFEIDTTSLELAELRMDLIADGKPVAETWLYRWTKS